MTGADFNRGVGAEGDAQARQRGIIYGQGVISL